MSASSALQALVGPIKYASAKGFANLHALKGLRRRIEGAVAKARAEGADAAALAALEHEAGQVDSADEAQRRAAVTRVGQTLASLGLPVGFDAVAPPKLEAHKPLPKVAPHDPEEEQVGTEALAPTKKKGVKKTPA